MMRARASVSDERVVARSSFDGHPALAPLCLVCGIASAVLYAAMLVFVPMQWPGYSSAAQTVSELSAIGARSRPLWLSLSFFWSLLYLAFGWAVWSSAGGKLSLRVTGAMIIVACIFGFGWPPMHQREVLAAGGKTLTDTLHLVWTAVNGVMTLLAMGFSASASGKAFRLYTIATMLILVAAGVMTSLAAPGVDANLPTPWIGVWERMNIGAWLLWVIVLAVMLLRQSLGARRRAEG